MNRISGQGPASLPPEEEALRPLYSRVLRLRHLDPGGPICFAFFEGALTIGLLLALAELINWWTVPLLPVVVALLVKGNDVVAGAVALAAERVPRLEQERLRRELAPAVGRAAVPAGGRRAPATVPLPGNPGRRGTGTRTGIRPGPRSYRSPVSVIFPGTDPEGQSAGRAWDTGSAQATRSGNENAQNANGDRNSGGTRNAGGPRNTGGGPSPGIGAADRRARGRDRFRTGISALRSRNLRWPLRTPEADPAAHRARQSARRRYR